MIDLINSILAYPVALYTKQISLIVLIVTATYWAVCSLLFYVERDGGNFYKYRAVDLRVRHGNSKFKVLFFRNVAQFQMRLCGTSALTLLMRLAIFYCATLSMSATVFSPITLRVKNKTEFAALVIWILANTLTDFLSFSYTKSVYKFLANDKVVNEKRTHDPIIWAVLRMAYCVLRPHMLFINHFFYKNIANVMLSSWKRIRTTSSQSANMLRKKIWIIIISDILFTALCFLVNAYLTNYCYLVLTNGQGYSFYTPISLPKFEQNAMQEIANHFYSICIINYKEMIESYFIIINSPFKVFGSDVPGMAVITFITMATSVGPATIFATHSISRLFIKKTLSKWSYPIYIVYVGSILPTLIIGVALPTSITAYSGAALNAAVILFLVIFIVKAFPKIMIAVNERYITTNGCGA